jgi:hypothetical protein
MPRPVIKSPQRNSVIKEDMIDGVSLLIRLPAARSAEPTLP